MRRQLVAALVLAGALPVGTLWLAPAAKADCALTSDPSIGVEPFLTGARVCVEGRTVTVGVGTSDTGLPAGGGVQTCDASGCTETSAQNEAVKASFDRYAEGQFSTPTLILDLDGQRNHGYNICTMNMFVRPRHEKAAGSLITHEYANGHVDVTCEHNPVTVSSMSIDVTVSHHCVPAGTHANDDSATTSGPTPIEVNATAYQQVPIWTWGQWCAYGSLLTWRFEGRAKLSSGASLEICAYFSANWGESPKGQRVTC